MSEYGKKFQQRLDRLHYVGIFTESQAKERGMRLAIGKEKSVCLYWLVDESDGVISDAKFQAFGPVSLILAAEIASEIVLRKNYDQASRVAADLLDQHIRDRKEVPAFDPKDYPFLNQVLSAMDRAVYQCTDIPYASADYASTPIEWDLEDLPGGIPGWDDLSLSQKIGTIETVIDKEIRPYVELDAGGVKIKELKENGELHIAYEGSCTTCHSATGSTLTAIQQILKRRVHPSLTVIPVL